ncbi:MAG: ABC transporter ATP-binding protein [Burkholderiales bacterium]
MEAVRIESLTKRFGSVVAVQSASLTVESGSFLTLLGPSGCGKSTVLRCLAGLETPEDGRIALDGRPVFDRGLGIDVPTEQRGLGMVFQSFAVWPHLDVAKNVAFGLATQRRAQKAIADAVRRVLALVRLEGYGARYPSQLSGGQLQRVALARALAYEPSLLLLDEPLANLDTHLREEMRAELRRIQRETGTTMVAVTHDQAEALSMSDRVVVLNAGRIEQAGSPRELFDRPATPFVAAFLGARNVLRGEAAGGSVTVDGRAFTFAPTDLRGAVEVRFRPDCARLLESAPANMPAIPVQVTSHEYLGTSCRVMVRFRDTLLEVMTPVDGVPEGGQARMLVLDPDRLHVFSA